MRRYLLDTPLLAALLRNRPATVARVVPWMMRHEAATSSLVYGEVIEYLKGQLDFHSRRDDLRTLLREIYPYSPTYSVLERYADIRRQLRPPYGPGLTGDIDTLIAATALERNLTLVTTDTDFQRVPSLNLMLLDRSSLS